MSCCHCLYCVSLYLGFCRAFSVSHAKVIILKEPISANLCVSAHIRLTGVRCKTECFQSSSV